MYINIFILLCYHKSEGILHALSLFLYFPLLHCFYQNFKEKPGDAVLDLTSTGSCGSASVPSSVSPSLASCRKARSSLSGAGIPGAAFCGFSRNQKASLQRLPVMGTLLARWQATSLLGFQAATLSAQSRVSCEARLRMRVCRMGATITSPAPLPARALKFFSPESSHWKGNRPPQPRLFMGLALAVFRDSPASSTFMAPGVKYRANWQMRFHPFSRTSGLSSTFSRGPSLEWNSRARGSSCTMAGMSSFTFTVTSTVSRVLVALWKKAVSANAPIPSFDTKGPTVACSKSSAQGASAVSSGMGLILRNPNPRKERGRFAGKLNWPGVYQTWALGNFCAKGPAKTLCSRPRVGKMICFTGPCSASRARTASMHSLVGATGAYTSSPPSFNLITVILIGTTTYKIP
mmetsp:Transcript_1378/g.1895  ORF Transcript_1378/g.1895 Transcript_1378/m.1895 type:complete len:405 (+) Transcript_1378:82-1296(+)